MSAESTIVRMPTDYTGAPAPGEVRALRVHDLPPEERERLQPRRPTKADLVAAMREGAYVEDVATVYGRTAGQVAGLCGIYRLAESLPSRAGRRKGEAEPMPTILTRENLLAAVRAHPEGDEALLAARLECSTAQVQVTLRALGGIDRVRQEAGPAPVPVAAPPAPAPAKPPEATVTARPGTEAALTVWLHEHPLATSTDLCRLLGCQLGGMSWALRKYGFSGMRALRRAAGIEGRRPPGASTPKPVAPAAPEPPADASLAPDAPAPEALSGPVVIQYRAPAAAAAEPAANPIWLPAQAFETAAPARSEADEDLIILRSGRPSRTLQAVARLCARGLELNVSAARLLYEACGSQVQARYDVAVSRSGRALVILPGQQGGYGTTFGPPVRKSVKIGGRNLAAQLRQHGAADGRYPVEVRQGRLYADLTAALQEAVRS